MNKLFNKYFAALVILTGLIPSFCFAETKSLCVLDFNINIESVSAVRNRDRSVSVHWIVAREVGTRMYELQKSADGVVFQTVETINETANDGAQNVYNLIDWNAGNDDVFYRIKATSLTGKATLSGIVKVGVLKITSPFSIYPNPSQNKLVNLNFSNQMPGQYQLILISFAGQQVWNTTLNVNNITNVRTFNLTRVSAGSYQLLIQSPDGTKTSLQLIIN